MFKKKSELKIAKEKAEEAIKKTNDRIDALGKETQKIYNELTNIQELFDKIRNVPSEKRLKYEETKQIRLNWNQQAEKIENDYKKAELKNAGAGVAGAGVGVAVVTMGPTIAMGVATTFGVASTGTAIASLHGIAQVNAALAWLGGGALVAGGGGMAAGNAFLALAGPVGWAIAGVSLLSSGLLFWKNKKNKKRLEQVFIAISSRDIKRYNLAIVEINERINRLTDETQKLHNGIQRINGFGLDYNDMSNEQQYELGSYVNLMEASTQLLINPILGLQSKYNETDFEEFINKLYE